MSPLGWARRQLARYSSFSMIFFGLSNRRLVILVVIYFELFGDIKSKHFRRSLAWETSMLSTTRNWSKVALR